MIINGYGVFGLGPKRGALSDSGRECEQMRREFQVGESAFGGQGAIGRFGVTAALVVALIATGVGPVSAQGTKAAPKATAPKAGAPKAAAKKPAIKVEKGANAAASGKLPAPTVTFLLKNADEAFADIGHLFKLANAEPQAKTLTDTLDLFLVEVTRSKPISVQGFLAGSDMKYVLSMPVADTKKLKDFLKNIDDLDLTNKPVVGTPNLFSINGLIDAGAFLRYDPTLAYALVAEWREEVFAYKTLPAATLLGSNDVVILIDSTKEQSAERKKAFDRLRKEGIDALKRNADETQVAFDVRKKAAIHQLDEIERYFVESEQIRIGWTTDVPGNRIAVDIDLTPLAGTPLADSVGLIGKSPNRFAKVSTESAVVVVDANFPLDEMHKTQLLEQVPLTIAAIQEGVDKNEKLSAAEKQTGKELASLGGKIAMGLTKVGAVNGCLRVYPGKGGNFVSIASGRIEDGASFTEFLKKAAERLGGAESLTVDVDQEGDVKIHKLSLAAYQKDFPELLAADGGVFVGVGPDQVWIGSGDGSLEKLKEAIKTANTGEVPESNVALSISGNLLPWAKILDREVDAKLGDAALRKMALEAFSGGGDTWSLKLWRDDKKAKVSLELNEGVLRFGGKVGAKFVKESLE
jgi:hypothetical protein